MIKRCSILGCVSSLFILMLFGIALLGNDNSGESLQSEYETLNKKFTEKVKTIRTRDAYNKLVNEHKNGLKSLLEKVEKVTLTDELELLKGKLLFDLKKTDEAAKIFEKLVKKQSAVTNRAKFEKVRLIPEICYPEKPKYPLRRLSRRPQKKVQHQRIKTGRK